MFQRIIRCLCLFSVMIMAGAVCAQNNDWANFKRYEQSNKEIINSPNNGHRVVFMGNSITDNWYAFHPNFFKDNGYIGRGIGGQTSYQYLLRFRQDVINLNPAIVVINAGTNDIAENTHPYNQDYTMGNIISMVQLAQANGIYVILTSTLPSISYFWHAYVKNVPEKIQALNKRVKDYAKKHDIPFVDYYSPLVVKETGALNPKYSKDGVHPTPEGYDIMEKIIKKSINKAFAKLDKENKKHK